MAKINPKAIAVRKIIKENIKLVSNGQDDIVMQMVIDQVDYSKPANARAAYHAQKEKAINELKVVLTDQALQPTLNMNGGERKAVEERKGKPTRANYLRELLTDAFTKDGDLGEVVEKLQDRIVADFGEKGEERDWNYTRLMARNEVERVAPKVQATLGMMVSTKTEIKNLTRRRKWERKNLEFA